MIKSIDVCVNPYFSKFKDKYLRPGFWKFLGPEWQKQAEKGWSEKELLSAMEQANVEMTGLVAFCASSPANGEDCFIGGGRWNRTLYSNCRTFSDRWGQTGS